MKNKKAAIQWTLGFLILVVLVWFQAISKTIETYQHNKFTKQQTEGFLKFQNEMLSNNVTTESIENTIQHALFSMVNSLCETHKVKLEEMSPPHQYTQNEIEVTIFKIQLTGKFDDLLRTLYGLEVGLKEGEIKGYRFKKIANRKTKKEQLQLHLWVQSMNIKT